MNFHLFSPQGFLCMLAFFFAGIVDSICGGGGLITIPAMLATGIPTSFITGTNQCSACLGTVASTYKYMKSSKIHYRSALITVPFAMIGSYIGARMNLLVPVRYLEIFMIVMVPVIALFMIINKNVGEDDKIEELSSNSLFLRSALIGLILGFYQGFYGPGGGMFYMLAYAIFLKLSLIRSTANTRFVVLFASIVSVMTYAFSGKIIWSFVIAATIFNMIGSYIGACLAVKEGSKIIRPIMLIVTALLMIKFVSSSL